MSNVASYNMAQQQQFYSNLQFQNTSYSQQDHATRLLSQYNPSSYNSTSSPNASIENVWNYYFNGKKCKNCQKNLNTNVEKILTNLDLLQKISSKLICIDCINLEKKCLRCKSFYYTTDENYCECCYQRKKNPRCDRCREYTFVLSFEKNDYCLINKCYDIVKMFYDEYDFRDSIIKQELADLGKITKCVVCDNNNFQTKLFCLDCLETKTILCIKCAKTKRKCCSLICWRCTFEK